MIDSGWSGETLAATYLAVAAAAAGFAALAIALQLNDSFLWGSAAIALSGATLSGLVPAATPTAVPEVPAPATSRRIADG